MPQFQASNKLPALTHYNVEIFDEIFVKILNPECNFFLYF